MHNIILGLTLEFLKGCLRNLSKNSKKIVQKIIEKIMFIFKLETFQKVAMKQS